MTTTGRAVYEQADPHAARLLEAVTALHRADEYEHESPQNPAVRTYCRECSNYSRRSFVGYPCQTQKLLATDSTPCPDCGHRHTPDGCAGPPTLSDVWAGVSPAICDCDSTPSEDQP